MNAPLIAETPKNVQQKVKWVPHAVALNGYPLNGYDFSFADATSFAVMERFAIRLAFTFDRDFAQYGFTILTAN